MKKVLGILFAMLILAGMAGCSSNSDEPSGTEPSGTAPVTGTPQGTASGEKLVVLGNARMYDGEDEAWAELIEESLGEKAKRTVRYAFRKEPDVFDAEKLQRIVDGLPAGYALKLIGEELFERCGKMDWCRGWVEQYADYDTYQKYGLGVVMLKDGELVSGASSYTGYIGGIEIQIDTEEDHRRKGFALICGAKLILECLNRGWYPSWDAQNKWSVALAEKLGYHFDREYTAYEVAFS